MNRRTMIAAPKNETCYYVYLEWPEGPGGATRYEHLSEAVEAARRLKEKYGNHDCDARLLKRTKKFISF